MKSYTIKNINNCLKKVGLKNGDIVFINPEIFRFGKLKTNKINYNIYEIFYENIFKIIGKNGTSLINTYTFDTLRYKTKFTYESKLTTCGGFSNFILTKKNVVRSQHPVFSVASLGKKAKFICKNNSKHNYGYNSPYEKFLRLNGKSLKLGQDYWLNPFYHVAEFMIGVPHYFNKYTDVEYFMNGRKKKLYFSSFVRYLNFELIENYSMLKKTIDKKKIVKKSKLGSGYIYSVDAIEYLKCCLELLSKDQFSLIYKNNYIKSQKN